jgi:hypothetical protein
MYVCACACMYMDIFAHYFDPTPTAFGAGLSQHMFVPFHKYCGVVLDCLFIHAYKHTSFSVAFMLVCACLYAMQKSSRIGSSCMRASTERHADYARKHTLDVRRVGVPV